MLPEFDRVRLRHMLDAAREARGFAQGRSREDLDRDTMLSHALVRCIEIVGEAATRVSEQTQGAVDGVPWRAIIGMRNRLIHAYFDIDKDVVWKTVTVNLVELEPFLLAALEDSEEEN